MARISNKPVLSVAFGAAALGALSVIAIVSQLTSSVSVVQLEQTQSLWNAAANDVITPPGMNDYDAGKLNEQISKSVAQADSQGDDTPAFKARTQELYIVPQANVLTGSGQKPTAPVQAPPSHVSKRAAPVSTAARMQSLWDAASNDVVHASSIHTDYGHDEAARMNEQIGKWNSQADSEGDGPMSFKARTQKLYIVPQANVLTGSGQKPKVAAPPKAGAAARAHKQALWNAAAESPESKYFKSQPVFHKGVVLQGHYEGHYDPAKQRSYIPSASTKARMQELWDAATNDGSLESTRQQLGMSSGQPHSARKSRDLSGQPRNYLSGMDYVPMNYQAGYGW
eukprot:CAMPEP_0181311006 /NCGR_PEP_ID=MMETSP1101-20121128/12899_1 /TAXON_ID=46948 /ORGANISM="Rhodomonas abbreviata, Strain Caron Lab Isolate" /LENGTH=339 /DNA_ID=CAMNT_0023417693 /DNA_START=10 /DNA_END=1029 /DNA_ORIENTATION=+